jgi:hypothetical protein
MLRRTGGNLIGQFLAGMGSVLEIVPPPSLIELTRSDDAEAIGQDWDAVAGDFWMAIGSHRPEPSS